MEPNVDDKPPPKGAPPKFVPDTRPVTGRSGDNPPTWAIAIMVAIIGLVGLIFAIGRWDHSLIPFSDSEYFWVGLIFLPFVALIVLAVASKGLDYRRAQSWSQTTGRIVSSHIEARHHRFQGESDTVKNAPAVEYEFEAGGRIIRGSRIGIGDDAGGAHTEATLARYPVDAEVTVFYDPADPKNCVLERGGPQGVTVRGCIGGLVVLAALAGAIW